MPCARSDVADSFIENGDLYAVENFTRIDIDQLAAKDDEIGFHSTYRATNEPVELLFVLRHDCEGYTKRCTY